MSFIKYRQFGNKEYAYELTSYRDSQTKKVKHISKYLGVVVDKERHIFERRLFRQRTERLILDFGDSYLVSRFIESTQYGQLFNKVFGKYIETLLALLTYRLCYSSAMMYAETWYEGNYAKLQYKDAEVSSQRISEFFEAIGNEELYQSFFREHISNICKSKSGIIVDTTSLQNQIHIPLTSWGRSGEEIDKQIRFLLVVDKDTSLPIFFRTLPGNIIDVSSLNNTTEELRHYGLESTVVCADAGFFSEDNILDLYAKNINFLMRLPAVRTLYRELIMSEIKDIESPSNGVRYGKRGLFIKRKKVELFGKAVYAYIVLDPERKGRETSRLIRQTADEEEKNIELEYNFMRRGVMILISSFDIPMKEIVPTYYLRQRAEVLFGFSKDDINILPLRVHKEETLRGFLFLQFLTLIIFAQLKKAIGEEHTVEEILLKMRNLKCKVYENEIIIGEITKEQKEICKILDVVVPKNSGIWESAAGRI